jgi:hypothetical protein
MLDSGFFITLTPTPLAHSRSSHLSLWSLGEQPKKLLRVMDSLPLAAFSLPSLLQFSFFLYTILSWRTTLTRALCWRRVLFTPPTGSRRDGCVFGAHCAEGLIDDTLRFLRLRMYISPHGKSHGSYTAPSMKELS